MKPQTIIPYIFAVVFLALLLNTCREKMELQKEAANTSDFLNDTIRYYYNELQRKDWAGFARGYNGPGYAKNRYDIKLANAYKKYSK